MARFAGGGGGQDALNNRKTNVRNFNMICSTSHRAIRQKQVKIENNANTLVELT